MTAYGVLVAPALFTLHRVLSWPDAGLIPMLRREIGDDLTAATVARPSLLVPGGLRIWCDDLGLRRTQVEHNDKALAVVRHFGYRPRALAGPIVFVGYPSGEDEVGLTPAMLDFLDESLRRMYAGGRGWPEMGV